LRPVPQKAFRSAGIPLTLRHQAGYDHSYYFTASFMADHVVHHARPLTPRWGRG
jgi:S-formylglutathione hydrolase